MQNLFFVVYDGIENSVFHSQVVAPLLAYKKAHPNTAVHIVSFEKNNNKKLPIIEGITFHILKRYSYVHSICLWPSIRSLRSLLQRYVAYEIRARGPFAGYIAYYAATLECLHISIQARGLVAQEYHYSLGRKKMNFFEQYRYKQFLTLEQRVYAFNKPHVTFEVVSPALKDYLITIFATQPERIYIAQQDIPAPLPDEQKATFRTTVRTALNIAHDAPVYCYSGSFKPWQCPQETLSFFNTQLSLNVNAVLLILTTDLQLFEHALLNANISPHTYRLLFVPADALLEYLAAADFGILIREKNSINTVSRPTKALEYAAAGLIILHNNTVPYVARMPQAVNIDNR